MKYKFFPHTADTKFEAYGKTVEELFENAGLAAEEVMVSTEDVKHRENHEIFLHSDSLENLLYDFLSELIFIKDTENLLFSKFEVVIIHKNKKYELIAQCHGDFIDKETQELRNDAKAITMHEFEIIQEKNNTWTAKVIVDI